MTEQTKRAPAKAPAGMARVRVLPLGDGKISTGETEVHGTGVVFCKAQRGDELVVQEAVALAQEKNGLVEIL